MNTIELIVETNNVSYMSHAKVKESGTHESLLKQSGEYAQSWALQAKAFMD
jgi:ABC-type multidrug transport system fused ATPase/permease subunit